MKKIWSVFSIFLSEQIFAMELVTEVLPHRFNLKSSVTSVEDAEAISSWPGLASYKGCFYIKAETESNEMNYEKLRKFERDFAKGDILDSFLLRLLLIFYAELDCLNVTDFSKEQLNNALKDYCHFMNYIQLRCRISQLLETNFPLFMQTAREVAGEIRTAEGELNGVEFITNLCFDQPYGFATFMVKGDKKNVDVLRAKLEERGNPQ
jgi:hypothetical protein